MAQISFSFSGGFWPISLPLFHGTSRPSALGAVLVAAYMNGSLIGGKEPHVDPEPRALVDPLLPVVRCDQSTVKSGREPGRTEVKRGALRPTPASRATGVRA